MYQPYPTSGGPVESERRPPAPPSVLNAVKLMYAGAALSAVSVIVTLADLSGLKSAIRTSAEKSGRKLTQAQIHQLDNFIVIAAIVSGAVGIAVWLWMAWANKQGKNWARILSTVVFVLLTADIFGVLSQPNTLLSLIFPMLTWLIGLGAVILLWRPGASAFFKPKSMA